MKYAWESVALFGAALTCASVYLGHVRCTSSFVKYDLEFWGTAMGAIVGVLMIFLGFIKTVL